MYILHLALETHNSIHNAVNSLYRVTADRRCSLFLVETRDDDVHRRVEFIDAVRDDATANLVSIRHLPHAQRPASV